MSETKKSKKTSRRKFLVRGGLGTLGVLALGTYVFRNSLRRSIIELSETLVAPYTGSGTEANLWIEVGSDNSITLRSPKVEMGQGSFTSFAQILADELDVNISQITVKAAETASGIIDGLSTGGSLSVAQLFQPLREMAATMREKIKLEAAAKLGTSVSALSTAEGIVSGGGKTMTYAEAVADVSDWSLPDTPELRPLKDYKYVGKPVARIDLKAKIMGEPIFGMDAQMENMLHAAVVRPEHVGASMKSVDTSAAEKMPGVVKVIRKDDWVGVIAESYPQALAAKRKLKVEWDIPKKWTEEDLRAVIKVGNGDKMITQKHGGALDVEDENTLSMEFNSPIGAHAQIEPNGAVASVADGKASVILSTQVIGITQQQVAEALGLELENVNVIGTYLGGGFGRRLNTIHAVRAALMSKEVGKPVKYFFTRKEEFQHDTFRPPTNHIMRGSLTENGNMKSLEHHYASGDVAYNSVIMPAALHTVLGADAGALRGGNIMYDNLDSRRAVQWHSDLPFATSWWRSLGLLANTFAIESFIDEMAIKAGKSPVDFRLAMLGNDGNALRIKKVIELAAEKGNYQDTANGNRAMGIAASIDANAPCAQVVEVSVENNQIKVHKVVCAFDCGIAVNPDQVRAQCEGSIIMGMSASMHEKMGLKDGKLFPTIYGPYDMALMRNAPKEIDVHLIQGADVPLPVGEPPLGPIAAAIANAVKRITGKRLTDLPMKLS
ncbi:MAG: molybdopterin cofactor-binding domain-containing protein [Bacteroidia bacterium]|nr:molybdopterin cofactor-binding domain-containing protein [Bacteroidia bacterium]